MVSALNLWYLVKEEQALKGVLDLENWGVAVWVRARLEPRYMYLTLRVE